MEEKNKYCFIVEWIRRRHRRRCVSNENDVELELELDSVEPITRFPDILTATVLP